MKARRPVLLAVLPVALVLGPRSQAALFPHQALLDHTLCCGTEGRNPSRHGVAERDSSSRSAASGAALVANTPVDAPAAAPAAVSAPASNAKAEDTAKPPKPLEEENGYVKLGFDKLSGYTFKVPPFDPAANPNVSPPTGEEQIPDWLKKLDGRKAVVTGFMLPLKMKDNLVTEFLLLSDPMMCCYGSVPEMNQWIVVKMKGGGVRPLQDVPISFYGEIKVKAMFENGYMTGIYALEGEKMGEVKG